jgi:hypothetical protein
MKRTLLVLAIVAVAVAYLTYDSGLVCHPDNTLAENVAIGDQIQHDLARSLQKPVGFIARVHVAARDGDLGTVKEQISPATSQHDLARPLSDVFNDCSLGRVDEGHHDRARWFSRFCGSGRMAWLRAI